MSKSSRVPVFFLTSSVTGPAPHRTSVTFALLLVNVNWAKQRTGNIRDGIIVLANASWATVKESFKGSTLTPVHKKLPPREPENLNLSYPPRNYESDGKEKQRQLWLQATRF